MNDDWALLESARQGKQSAWNELVSAHRKRLLKMLCILLGSSDSAEDIVQETFLRLFQNRNEFYRGNFYAFLSKIAYNLALKSLSHRIPQVEIGDMEIADSASSAMDCLIREEKNLLLWEVVSSLEAEFREVISLRFYAGHSYIEIAEILNLPLGTVKSRIFYAVQKCRQRLHSKGYKNEPY